MKLGLCYDWLLGIRGRSDPTYFDFYGQQDLALYNLYPFNWREAALCPAGIENLQNPIWRGLHDLRWGLRRSEEQINSLCLFCRQISASPPQVTTSVNTWPGPQLTWDIFIKPSEGGKLFKCSAWNVVRLTCWLSSVRVNPVTVWPR